ncbi:MAG: hypothetical protein IT369_04690 [Candidatus Latescibacteria bacterium]|nr:hypothetical protein [Candidatus Latescibacterota bacterium]
MQLICSLPTAPRDLFAPGQDEVVLVFDQGLASIGGAKLEWRVRGEVGGAALDARGALCCTVGKQILSLASGNAEPQDLSAAFGGPPGGSRRVSVTPDGALWVEGCAKRQRLDGSFVAVPAGPTPAPVPLAVDLHANLWTLTADGQVAVLPVDAPEAWQLLPAAGGPWQWLVADHVGNVWVGGKGGLRCFDPHRPEQGWRTVVLPGGAPTALGLSPGEQVLVGQATGEVLEVDLSLKGELISRSLARTPGAVRAVCTDGQGALWAATAEGLYRRGPAAAAWQHAWQQVGRLPGSNHDIFAAPLQGRLYVAGGLTADWGLPARSHVFDELWRFCPQTGCWELVNRLSFPRRFNGIAALDGTVWVVGGEGEIKTAAHPEGERLTVDVVDIYDPATATWTAGPRLNDARSEPFVIAEAGRIWAVAGACNPNTAIASVESIAPGESAWRYEQPMPVPTRQGSCCALEGVLYCVSAEGFFAFDTATRRWLTGLPQLEKSPQAAQVAAYAGEVWVMGGHLSHATWRYSPAEQCWRPGPALPTFQSWGAAAVLEGRLYLAGGAHWSALHERFVFDDRTYVLRPGWA